MYCGAVLAVIIYCRASLDGCCVPWGRIGCHCAVDLAVVLFDRIYWFCGAKLTSDVYYWTKLAGIACFGAELSGAMEQNWLLLHVVGQN